MNGADNAASDTPARCAAAVYSAGAGPAAVLPFETPSMNTSTSGGDVTTVTTAEDRASSSVASLPAPTAAVIVAVPGLYPNCFAVRVCSPTTTGNVVLAFTARPSS